MKANSNNKSATNEKDKIYNFLGGVFAELKRYQVFGLVSEIVNNPNPLNCLLESTHDPNEPEKIVMDYGSNVFVANCNGTLCIIGLGKPAGYSNRVPAEEIAPYPMNLVRIPLDIQLKDVTNTRLMNTLILFTGRANEIYKGVNFLEKFMVMSGHINETFEDFYLHLVTRYEYNKGKLFCLDTGKKKSRIVKLRKRKIDVYNHIFRPRNMKNIVEYIVNYN